MFFPRRLWIIPNHICPVAGRYPRAVTVNPIFPSRRGLARRSSYFRSSPLLSFPFCVVRLRARASSSFLRVGPAPSVDLDPSFPKVDRNGRKLTISCPAFITLAYDASFDPLEFSAEIEHRSSGSSLRYWIIVDRAGKSRLSRIAVEFFEFTVFVDPIESCVID